MKLERTFYDGSIEVYEWSRWNEDSGRVESISTIRTHTNCPIPRRDDPSWNALPSPAHSLFIQQNKLSH